MSIYFSQLLNILILFCLIAISVVCLLPQETTFFIADGGDLMRKELLHIRNIMPLFLWLFYKILEAFFQFVYYIWYKFLVKKSCLLRDHLHILLSKCIWNLYCPIGGSDLIRGGGLLYSNNVIFLQYPYTMAREIIVVWGYYLSLICIVASKVFSHE
jgi:hypothetical protein